MHGPMENSALHIVLVMVLPLRTEWSCHLLLVLVEQSWCVHPSKIAGCRGEGRQAGRQVHHG